MDEDELPRTPEPWEILCNQALDRMRRASIRGTGCHLTAEMIWALSLSFVGATWNQENYTKGLEVPPSEN